MTASQLLCLFLWVASFFVCCFCEEATGIEAGTISSLSLLGSEPLQNYFPVATFLMTYYTQVDGAMSKTTALLAFPMGNPPHDGWPVHVYLHDDLGPGYEYWHWPFLTSETFHYARAWHQLFSYSSRGFVSVAPYAPGVGLSEPFASSSSLSSARNARVVLDLFSAIGKVSDFFGSHGELSASGVWCRIDTNRIILGAEGASAATLMHLAGRWRYITGMQGLQALVVDRFYTSPSDFLWTFLPRLFPPYGGSAAPSSLAVVEMLSVWASQLWCKASVEELPLDLFFTRKAIGLFNKPETTLAGSLPLMRTAVVSQFTNFDGSATTPTIANALWTAITTDLSPNQRSELAIARWIFAPAMVNLMLVRLNETSRDQLLTDPLFQEYFAVSDPYWDQTAEEPFEPNLPLYAVHELSTAPSAGFYWGLFSPAELYAQTVLPKFRSLANWGWKIYSFSGVAPSGPISPVASLSSRGVAFSDNSSALLASAPNPDEYATSYRNGAGLKWVIAQLQAAMYGTQVPSELHPLRIPGWVSLVLVISGSALLVCILAATTYFCRVPMLTYLRKGYPRPQPTETLPPAIYPDHFVAPYSAPGLIRRESPASPAVPS
ncbi:hypothetical protein PAPYR_9025 [Paratrimastix pyriformis]|uniref:Uncharacterized protein n=1 Tax=Paratrimastix pyriformis TaxID=342808 RepID=A0ABQ8U9E8_9EUKA|nr:hypothetical protein PAPYR_9025 [Paratrimastix pyriformis]